MQRRALAWRVEETCLNAWPALRQVLLDDWLLRFSDGLSRRANSVTPLRGETTGDIDASVATCEALYRAQGLPTIFRVPSIVDRAVENRLERLGYRAEGETVTLYSELDAMLLERDADVEILSRPSADWLGAMAALQRQTEKESTTYARIVGALALPAGFAAIRERGQMTALAYGAVHDGVICYESVVTDARHRGRGFAHRLLGAFNVWAASGGARGVCLQVEAANAPAWALYRSIGLRAELYRYHYRREPTSGEALG